MVCKGFVVVVVVESELKEVDVAENAIFVDRGFVVWRVIEIQILVVCFLSGV